MDGNIRLTILPRRSQPKFKIKLTRDDVQDINLMIVQLRSDKKKRFKQEAIKLFVKKKYPEEYRLHELHSDWDRCSLTRSKLYYWINKHKISNEFEAQKQKRKESIISKINLTRLEKIQIILKSIELKKLGIYKFNYMAIKWFLKLYYPKQYRLHLKFNDFEKCSKSSIKFLINKFIMYE
jgi:hypothetical protein